MDKQFEEWWAENWLSGDRGGPWGRTVEWTGDPEAMAKNVAHAAWQAAKADTHRDVPTFEELQRRIWGASRETYNAMLPYCGGQRTERGKG